jgi:hypothetical protein
VGGFCFLERRLEVWMKTQGVAFLVLNELDTSLTCCIFGQSVVRNLKVKITAGVIWQLAVPQSV